MSALGQSAAPSSTVSPTGLWTRIYSRCSRPSSRRSGTACSRNERRPRRLAVALALIRLKVERLVDSIANGTPPAAVNGRIVEMENRRKELELTIANGEAPAPRLHPNLAGIFRQTVAPLLKVLAQCDAAEAGTSYEAYSRPQYWFRKMAGWGLKSEANLRRSYRFRRRNAPHLPLNQRMMWRSKLRRLRRVARAE